MQLILSVEGQNCTQIGLSEVLSEVQRKLAFLRDQDGPYAQKYGTEFDSITIIPTCVSDRVWHILGWKERILLRRKKREADIRLRLDYEQFINADHDGKQDMFVSILIKSIRAVQERSKGDFNADALIEDILMVL